jgi:hypothetical protein
VHGYAWGCLAAEGLGGHVGAGPRRAADALAGLRNQPHMPTETAG